MVKRDNLLARAILHTVFDKQGWESIQDREMALDLACQAWTTNVPASEAVRIAKEGMKSEHVS